MNEKTRDFIEKNLDADVRRLALKGCRDQDVDFELVLRQVAGIQKSRQKLPSWAASDGILYPQHLSLEQCSSEQTARYKASVCQRLIAKPSTLIDLTGGFGVDVSFMSQAFDEAVYVEKQEELFHIVEHNMRLLTKNVRCLLDDGVEVLHRIGHVSMIYMDPARRDDKGSRTYGIAECTPNVLELKEELLDKADVVMLKLSPMLDWQKAVEDLGSRMVSEVHIVSVQNECKELLVVMSRETAAMRLFCVNDDHVWEPFIDEGLSSASAFSSLSSDSAVPVTGDYLYEPNASIMKAGCFKSLVSSFHVSQLESNSHLFVSEKLIDEFPGRKFRIAAITTMNKRELRDALRDIRQANITVRNFPMSVADLRKRLKMGEGGSNYIFATTLAKGLRVLIICQRI